MKKQFFLIAILGILSADLFSQAPAVTVKGYVITLKDDTLRGDIKLNPKKELEVFEKVTIIISPTEKKTFKPEKIKGYSTDSAVFVSKKLDDAMSFFKVLSAGKLNLYEYDYYWEKPNKEVVTKSEYYMEKNGADKTTKIKEGSKYKKQLAEAMADNSELVKSFDEKEFDAEDMVDIFKQYNTEAK
jgi:hypothetical protein